MKLLGLNLNNSSILLKNCSLCIEVTYCEETEELKKKLEELQIFINNEYKAESGRDTIEINYEALCLINDNDKAERFSDILSRYASLIEIFIARI